MELSPEDRQRIYLEEKARVEIRRQLEPKKTSLGTVVFWGVSGLILLWMVGLVISEFDEQARRDRENSLTPAQRRAESYASCIELEQGWQFKTYSELSIEERRIKLSCDLLSAEGKSK